ncbi:hypothetical protein D3C87_1917630 [compost metagenome]
MQPDPIHARNLGQLLHQLRQSKPFVQIHPVIGGILGNQTDLPDTLGSKSLRFSHYGFHRAAVELAAHDGNAAEGARIVAAFGNFDMGGITWP